MLLIAPDAGADLGVGRLFAVFHDCCRVDDGSDLDHGPRAAALVRSLLGAQLSLDERRAELLLYAIEHHTSGLTSDDPTIGTCWDADRLDLGRVGIAPSAAFMSTAAGKEIATLGTKHLYEAAPFIADAKRRAGYADAYGLEGEDAASAAEA